MSIHKGAEGTNVVHPDPWGSSVTIQTRAPRAQVAHALGMGIINWK